MDRATELNLQGIRYKQQGEFAKAEACYEQAVQLDPSCAEVHYNLGLLLRDLCRVDGAIHCFERSAALRPDIAAIQLELGQLYLSQHRWIDAERSFEQLITISPRNVDALLGTATAFHQQGKLADAVAAYQIVLQEQPNHSAARTNLGIALKGLGKIADAIQCFERALQANPSQMEARVNLGNSLLECGRFTEASEVYRVAAELQPHHPQSHVNLGNAQQRQQQVREAMHSYQRAIELDPRCTDAWVNTTHLRKEIGDFDQARQAATALSRLYPTDPIHALRSAAICPLVFRNRAELDDYREHFITITNAISLTNSKLEFERWTVYAPECPYNLQFLDGNLRPLKEAFAGIYAPPLSRMQPETSTRPRRTRPRIGFLVTARHEQAFLKLLGGVVNRLSRARWELVCLCSQLGHEKLRHGLNQEVSIIPFPERFDHIVATVSDAA